MYDQDTFFNLTPYGRFGLVLLSLLLFGATCFVYYRVSKRLPIVLKILAAILFLWLFIWLSPQVYYTYYLTLFDFLEPQIVIQEPPSLMGLWQTITFTGEANLSVHGKGVLFWSMMAIGFLGNKNAKA